MMAQSELQLVTGAGGWRGQVDRRQVLHQGERHALVSMDGMDPILIPVGLLQAQQDGSYYLPLTREQLMGNSSPVEQRQATPSPASAQPRRADAEAELVVPVAVEEIEVRKRQWETGGVRVHIDVREREEIVDQPMTREEVRVERVPINQMIDSPPPTRQEGATTVIPVVEEVLVVEKRLLLKEEVRITKRTFEAHEPQTVVLRSEDPRVERLEADQRSDEERRAA
ncbi:MAG: YsnF/AvaK domain-containing protein [Actinomycetota bacterium]